MLDPCALFAAAGMEPDLWQAELARTPHHRVLVLSCRQAGKSTATAALALSTALRRDGATVLLVAPSLRQSTELMRKVRAFYAAAGRPVDTDAESVLRMELPGGSRIIALPGSEQTIRGFSAVDLIVVDEAAAVPDETYYSVRPMLAVSGGRLIAISTPRGKRGWFYRAWSEGGPQWHRIRVTAHDCPRMDTKFLAEERLEMGERWFAQEYLCEFLDLEGAVFTDEMLAAFTDEKVSAWEPV